MLGFISMDLFVHGRKYNCQVDIVDLTPCAAIKYVFCLHGENRSNVSLSVSLLLVSKNVVKSVNNTSWLLVCELREGSFGRIFTQVVGNSATCCWPFPPVVQGVQAHSQKVRFGENPGKICGNLKNFAKYICWQNVCAAGWNVFADQIESGFAGRSLETLE